MASERLTKAVSEIITGEDGDVAYARLFGSQCRPCDFRRWYSQVRRDGTCEMGEEMTQKLKAYIDEGIEIDDAFKDYVPDYIGPGEFGTAYTREMRARKAAAANAPVVQAADPEPVTRRKPRIRQFDGTAHSKPAEPEVIQPVVAEQAVGESPVTEG